MSVLGYSRVCDAMPCRTHCYIPVAPATVCSSDVIPTFGLCIPSSYQDNLWLLDNCQGSSNEAPSCEFLSCEPKTCTTSCVPSVFYVPCNSPSSGKECNVCKTTNNSPSPSCSPGTQTKGYVSDCDTRTRCTSKTCQTLRSGSNYFGKLNCLSKIFQPLSDCQLGSLGYRRSPDLSFKPCSFSPSCYISSNYQPQCYLARNCHYLNYGSMSCRPLGYLSRNFHFLSCIPSTFPPLRYLCSGNRPLPCY
ncbi:keratin-associated protein 24-1 [Dasypus novemcinctus]|uniref:keratin-associated protein 24-1 n=1 Tax=Dasypus novemcinctus TaxID=9361 RepID=UPI00265FD687|nr:keratin-associated protein 24-1 [Dasypus novemcinctus]